MSYTHPRRSVAPRAVSVRNLGILERSAARAIVDCDAMRRAWGRRGRVRRAAPRAISVRNLGILVRDFFLACITSHFYHGGNSRTYERVTQHSVAHGEANGVAHRWAHRRMRGGAHGGAHRGRFGRPQRSTHGTPHSTPHSMPHSGCYAACEPPPTPAHADAKTLPHMRTKKIECYITLAVDAGAL